MPDSVYTLFIRNARDIYRTSENRYELNKNLAQMLKGGVIMDVTTPGAGENRRGRGRLRRHGAGAHPGGYPRGGRRVADERPEDDQGHPERRLHPGDGEMPHRPFCGGADSRRPSRSTTSTRARFSRPADDRYHIDKTRFDVPFVCGARDLGEALRRIAEGASMIRTKGEPGTGDVVQAVRHMRHDAGRNPPRSARWPSDELFEAAKQLEVPYELVLYVHEHKKLPGRQLRSRRRRDARGRGADDAAWRGGRVRRLRHLQIRQPREARRRPSSRRLPIITTRICWPRCRRTSAKRWSASTSRKSSC